MPAVYVEIIRYALGSTNATVATLSGEFYSASDALRLGFVHKLVPPKRLLDAAIDRARAVPADAMAAYAYAKRGLQAPFLANIEQLADPLDGQLAAAFSEPGNLRVQRTKFAQLSRAAPRRAAPKIEPDSEQRR